MTLRRESRGDLESQTLAALEAARETWAWDFVHSPWDSTKVETQAVILRNRLRELSLLDGQAVIDAEPRS